MKTSVYSSNSAAHLGRVLVLGLGKSGLASAEFCASQLGGLVDCVTIYTGGDSEEIRKNVAHLEELGCEAVVGDTVVRGSYDIGIVSPGIPEHSEFRQNARALCDELISEPELAWRMRPHKWVGVTGTNGKTTVTSLITYLMTNSGMAARAVGNIGDTCIEAVSEKSEDILVAELSSYQLASSPTLAPSVAILLNVTPDHLSWHHGFDAYVAAKAHIFANLPEDGLAIVDSTDGVCAGIASDLEKKHRRVLGVDIINGFKGHESDRDHAGIDPDGMLHIRLDGVDHFVCHADELLLSGPHNYVNALCAAAAALECGAWEPAVVEGLKSFEPLEHRNEIIARIAGVTYVNDSKATNPDAVIKALGSYEPGTIVLLVGGHDKGVDLTQLMVEVARTCRTIICFGEAAARFAHCARKLRGSARLDVLIAANMAGAVDMASLLVRKGNTVLLSPACSSFDEFSGFEERGREFKRIVAAHVDNSTGRE